MKLLFKIYNYWKNPKYRVMKGICIDNRCIMFIGAYPTDKPIKYIRNEIKVHGYFDKNLVGIVVEFRNQKFSYYKRNMYCRIWTFKQLIKWVRFLPNSKTKCLQKPFKK